MPLSFGPASSMLPDGFVEVPRDLVTRPAPPSKPASAYPGKPARELSGRIGESGLSPDIIPDRPVVY